ncbi:hypothetical protein ILUMI_03310 [Ignelater luminosus]|uniref:Uncharacterized protein n=1 Tax=Ignelater luminosus TaxID=2038154 RepID=A0A8K0DM22_IGNLU|nr:hypothetical protein ILUMI_03310 [Ignelater luminosus]
MKTFLMQMFYYVVLAECIQASVPGGLKWVRVNVPQYRSPGEMAQLLCDYELGNDTLYAVKWYKEHEEFYRFVPKARPQANSYKVEGVHVDGREVEIVELSRNVKYRRVVVANLNDFVCVKPSKTLIGETLRPGELKKLLTDHFGDQRDEASLVQDLILLTPTRGEKYIALGKRCQDAHSRLLAKIKLTIEDASTRTVKTTMYETMALQTYLHGLVRMGELGHRIRYRRLTYLEQALAFSSCLPRSDIVDLEVRIQNFTPMQDQLQQIQDQIYDLSAIDSAKEEDYGSEFETPYFKVLPKAKAISETTGKTNANH